MTYSHYVTQSFQASWLGRDQRSIGVAKCNYRPLCSGCRIDQGQAILTVSITLAKMNLILLFTGNHVVSPPLAQTCSPIPCPHIFWKEYRRVRGRRLETIQESHGACILWCEYLSVNLPATLLLLLDWRRWPHSIISEIIALCGTKLAASCWIYLTMCGGMRARLGSTIVLILLSKQGHCPQIPASSKLIYFQRLPWPSLVSQACLVNP